MESCCGDAREAEAQQLHRDNAVASSGIDVRRKDMAATL